MRALQCRQHQESSMPSIVAGPIVAGRFQRDFEARIAVRALSAHGFPGPEISVFIVNAEEAAATGRQPGVWLAVHAGAERSPEAAVVLGDAGARDIEQTEGRWENGCWMDFAVTRVRQERPAPPAKPVDPATALAAVTETGNEDPGSELEQFAEAPVQPAVHH
jgi:hypothetical protein